MISFQEDENGVSNESESYKRNVEILIWCYVSMRDATVRQYEKSSKLTIISFFILLIDLLTSTCYC